MAESACAGGDAAFGEELAQAFDGAADALLRGVVADPEGLRHLAGGLAFEVTQQQRVAIRLAQFAQGGVEKRGDVFPVVRLRSISARQVGFVGKQIIHGGGLLIAVAAAHVGADSIGGDILRRAMQPAGQDGTLRELPRVLGQRDKRALRHVLGQVRVTDHSQRGGIDEVNVPSHEFGKRRFRSAAGVIPQELSIGQTVHSQNSKHVGRNGIAIRL